MQINMDTLYSKIIPHNQSKIRGIIMSNSLANKVQHNVEDALDDVARSLRNAAEGAHEVSGGASEVLSKAAADLTRAAESLRKNTVTTARNVARKATEGVQEHPIVSLAAAIAAAAALVGVIVATRHKDV
jgi:ElaB/YqjD/DUF883 family membrane-anchored ribosome-binding protein